MKKTIILLISPPETLHQWFVKHNIYFPLGLMMLASMVRDISEVKIINCMLTNNPPTKQGDLTRVGMSDKEIEKQIKKFKPDIVGISVTFFPLIGGAKAISKICKKINKNIVVVFGGAYTSIRYEKFLLEKNCEYCVVGEGEETFREFVEKYNSNMPLTNIKGIAYKVNDKVILEKRELIKDLDKLPYPAYDLIDVNEYLKKKLVYTTEIIPTRVMPILTSRGCPFNCVFCAIKKHMGQQWRPHSPEYVINHIKYLMDNFGIKKIHILDDNFSADNERCKKILDGITPFKLKWDDPSGMRADMLNYDLLKKMKESGNTDIQIAIESGNQKVLNNIIKKDTSLKKIEEVVKDCKKLNIKLSAFYIIGFPGETIKTMKQTIDYAIRLLKDYNVSPCLYVANPIFGTDLYKTCEDNGYIKKGLTEKDLASGMSINGTHLISTKEFNSGDIDKLVQYYQYQFNRQYHFQHPIMSIRTFVSLFKQHPLTTLEKTFNVIVNKKVELIKVKS